MKRKYIRLIKLIYIIVASIMLVNSTYFSSYAVESEITAVTNNPVIANGTYYFVNVELENYMQIDDNATATTEGAKLELWNFDVNTIQKWNIEILTNGYYKISSATSSKAITAPYTANESLKQTGYGGAYTQQWTITDVGNEMFKLSPRSHNSYYMAAGGGILTTEGRNVELRAEQSDNKDEWWIVPVSNTVQLEPQQQSEWCWVASARMASMIFMRSPISQASAAVYVTLNEESASPSNAQIAQANVSVSIPDTEKALEYILKSNNCYNKYRIYDETTLMSLLDDNNPVIILRGRYDDSGNREGGHYVIIYDYHWDSINSLYVYDIFDPWAVNVGNSYSRSYQSICNGRNTVFTGDRNDTGKWEGVLVYKYGDYQNTIAAP